ncbi:MAG TPA: M42 family metallopeptidase [Firmicutes bacterium]|nr:M42 family metallopeptidase [Bacillota bacterium]
MTAKDLLRALSGRKGVSGCESDLVPLLTESFAPLVDEIREDKLGNLVMLRRGSGPEPRKKVMLAAHMDEIGLVITGYEPGGFLRFASIGGIDDRVLLAQQVIVHGRKDLLGVIGAKPPHIQEPDEQDKTVKMKDLFIDVGLDDDTVKELVAVGDTATIAQQPVDLLNGRLAGKALDDRAGVAVMYLCLEVLSRLSHRADVYVVATVQEEVGLRGAVVSTYGIVPDIGIAIDVGHGDMPGVPSYDTLPMGKGPGIAYGPQVHPKIYQRLVELAKKWSIPYSVEPSTSPGGTDAYAIQVTQHGIPTALISLPLRYMHTAVETLDWSDLDAAARLLALFICSVDSEFVEGLTCF